MKRIKISLLDLLLLITLLPTIPALPACHFPESSTQSFFFDVRADVPIGSVIVDSVVEPADVQLKVLDVRANNLKGNFISRFEVVQRPSGQFLVLTAGDLKLPAFPSTINETTLYLTVECNQKAYPLISVRVRNYNSEAPQFLGEPYEMALVQETPVGNLVQTPILALDADPADSYTVTYSILNWQQNREFQLEVDDKPIEDLSTLPELFRKRPYSRQQLPHLVQLRILSPLRRKTYYLNVSATDNQDPPKQSTTLFKIMVGQQNEIMPHFTQQEYYANFTRSFEPGTEIVLNQPLMAVFPEPISRKSSSPVRYQLIDGKNSHLFELQEETGRLFLRQRPFGNPIEQLELEVKAFLDSAPEKFVKAKLLLNDVSEVHLTYFAQCHYEVHLAENSAPNTKVAQFVVRGDIAGIDLLNGTEYFNVDTDGTVTVAKDTTIDFEETDRIIVTARLRSSSALHPKSLELCQIATLDVHIDDVNDHSPKFEQQTYTFYTDEFPYNNTEIGTIRARDEDKGPFGKVHYRLLDSDTPFILFEADGEVTIYYVTKSENDFPDRSYTITVEAYDAKEYPRTARVNVRVLLQPAPPTQSSDIAQSTDGPTTSQPTIVVKKADKQTKPIRTHGAVNEERERLEVDDENKDQKEVDESKEQKAIEENEGPERTTETAQEFEAGPGTFDDSVEEETRVRSEGVVGEEQAPIQPSQKITKSTPATPREPPRFEQQNYNFSIDGKLEHNQYIGAIRLMQIEEENGAEDFGAGVEYTVEEGINGFVRIDPEDGILRIDNKLIEDSYEQIRFAAQAREGGRIIASTVVSVYMNESADIYAQDPRFEQALYRFELEENQPAQQFAQVHAHHRAVELDKDHIWYTLNRDKDAAAFRIDPETGQLRSLEPLDAETKKFYSLKINACLESSTKRCAHSEAIVVIKDLNDNEPQFDQQQYNLKLPPDLSAGTEVLQVHASDKDSGLNGETRYELLPSHAADHFTIDPITGQIRLSHAFGDAPTQLRFRVAAKDRAEPPMQGLAEVWIELTKDAKFTNENAPEFDDFRYEFSRTLPIPAGTLVATVHASDSDEGENGRVWYKFAEDTPVSRKFTVDKESGQIRTLSALDTSMSGQLLQLLIEAHDSSVTFARKSDTVVLLHLLGAKEERLEFLPLPKTVYISSAKPLGSTIFKVGLKNADLKDAHYTVEQDPRAELFAMIDDLLVVQSKLRPGSYRITIKAQAIPMGSDSLQQKTMSVESHSLRMVVMTDRDKYPVFDKLSYELKIASNANFPVKLPGFNASVNEGRVGYSLYNAHQLKGVKIDSITGELTIFEEFVDQVAEDLPRGMVFIVVRATNVDHTGYFSDVGVRLGLLSSGHELVFSSRLYRLITKENAAPGTVINTVKVGILEPELFPSVRLSLQPSDYFDISQNGSVIVKKSLDLESLPPEWKGIVEVTVTARHVGQIAKAQIQIKIEDVNEFAPQFDQLVYEFKVDVSQPEGTWIGQVHARDEDYGDKNALVYRAIFGNAIGLVNVTRDGKLILNRGAQLELNKNYSLIIQASDSGRKISETAVHFFPFSSTAQPSKPIDIPQMEKWVPTSETDKMMLPSMSTDGNWQFEIMAGNEMDRIRVEKLNKTTAQLGLRTERLHSPDNLQKAVDLIALEITNLDDPFERLHTNISVDLNKILVKKLEFADERKNINVDLGELDSQTTPIYKIPIRGASTNSKDLHFELADNPLDIFRLDQKTGQLYIEWPLEQLIPGTHQILVKVHLQKQTIQRIYTIKFTGELSLPLSFDSTSPIPSESPTLSESDLSTSLNPNSSSHEVFTEQPTVPTSLEDSVDEQSTTVGTSVTIASGEEPEGFGFVKTTYTFEVKEPKKGGRIGELKLRGAQGPVQWLLEPKAYRQWFDINQTTGLLYMKDVPFELKGRQRAEFTVQVVELENLSNRAQVNVSVDLLLPDSASREEGETTTDVEVHDGSVETGNEEDISTSTQPIQTQPSTQSAQTTQPPSTPSTDETPIFDSTPDLNPPTTKPDSISNLPTVGPIPEDRQENDQQEEETTFHFKHHTYTAMLPERDYGNRGTVVNLKPAPLKEGLDDVVFGIDSVDPNLPFFVRNRTGELIAFDNIDREQVAEFRFNVTAHSPSDPSKRARALIRVTVLDVNDNYPRFQNPTHVVPINADSKPGQVLATFKATDADDGSNGRVAYRMKENVGQFFDINSKGELTLTTKVAAFPADLMNLTIEAIDGGRPALRTQHQIQIQVFHENQPQPHFPSKEYTIEVGRGSDIGGYVTQVVAGVGPLNYLILDDNSNLFTIDNRGLVQLVRKPIADDQNRYHTLTVIAESPDGKTANTTLNVFVEGEPIVVTAKPILSSSPSPAQQKCQFTAKTYNAEIKENTQGRTKLATVKATCALEKVRFRIHQATKEFQIDEQTGDVFAVEPLDREKKGLHLVVVNLTMADEPKRQRRQPQTINPIAEFVKNKLAPNQALVLVRVLDQNDNPPTFTRLTSQNQYVFTADWQAPLLQPIARIQAVDPDEHPQLRYSISSNDYFIINETSGVIMVQRSLLNIDEEVFDLEVSVSDGEHEATAPTKIYKLAPGLNIAILTVPLSEQEVDETSAARRLSQLLDKEARVLVKQVYIGEDGHADPKQTHLFVYAIDRETRKPVDGFTLKSMLDKLQSTLQTDHDIPVSSISLPATSSTFHFTVTEMILLGISACLVFMVCCVLVVVLRCCKRKTILAKPDMNYMVESRDSNPRPYNVELISRKQAQQVLAARPLPDSHEEITMSPESRASMIASAGIHLPSSHPQNSSSQRTISSTVTDEIPHPIDCPSFEARNDGRE